MSAKALSGEDTLVYRLVVIRRAMIGLKAESTGLAVVELDALIADMNFVVDFVTRALETTQQPDTAELLH